jgi:MFS family permease
VTLSPEGSSGRASRSGRAALALAVAAAYLARTVPGATVESLRAELWLTDQALGTLLSAFAGPFALGLPMGAWLARGERRRLRILAVGLAVAGAATALAPLARGFWSLVLTRCVAGLGAGVGAGAVAGLLVGVDRVRGRALPGLGSAAAGVALGYGVGGLCARFLGWRVAFWGAGGMIGAAALLCLLPADPQRRGPDPWPDLRVRELVGAARRILADRSRLLRVLAAACGASAASGLLFWLPAFLVRGRSIASHVAGAELAAAVLASAVAGAALARGALRPDPRTRAPAVRASWTAAVGTGTAALALAAAFTWAYQGISLPALMVALLGLGVATYGAVASSAPGDGREPLDAAVLGLALLAVHGLGETSGAFALGALADRASFGRALYLLPGLFLASGLLWAAAAWSRAARAPAEAGSDGEVASP